MSTHLMGWIVAIVWDLDLCLEVVQSLGLHGRHGSQIRQADVRHVAS